MNIDGNRISHSVFMGPDFRRDDSLKRVT